MKVHSVPPDVWAVLEREPQITGKALSKITGRPARSCRRYVQHYRIGRARCGDSEVRVTSESLDSYVEFCLDDFLNEAPALVEKANQRDPVITFDRFDFNTKQPVAVIFPSCMHLGGRWTAYREFRQLFDRILDMPGIYWASLGDDIEGFLPQFRNARAKVEQLLGIDEQLIVLEHVLDKLYDKNKLLFGVEGQHSGEWMNAKYGYNPIKRMYLERGVPYFDGKGYAEFIVGAQTYNVAFSHKFKGNSIYNPSHPQARATRWDFPNADVVVMGDKHFPSVQQFPIYEFEVEAGHRQNPMVLLLQSGTAKTGPDPYTIKGWSRGRLGWPIVIFSADEHYVRWTWRLDDVEKFLM